MALISVKHKARARMFKMKFHQTLEELKGVHVCRLKHILKVREMHLQRTWLFITSEKTDIDM